MADRRRLALFAALAALCLTASAHAQTTSTVVDRGALRVCADPANMPFSNERREGFENKIAALLGEWLDIPVIYTWFPQATGFVRNTLRDKKCDVIMGYAQGHELVLNTNHYYRSTYVLIHPVGDGLEGLTGLDDPRLSDKKIGVIAGTPPATLMALHGLLPNAEAFKLMVDRRHEAPAERMMEELEAGEIDLAILWGPIGGWLAGQSDTELTVAPITPEANGPRMAYRITFGVRRGEIEWKRRLNRFIEEKQAQIDEILLGFGVPLLDEDDRMITQ